MNRVMYYGAKLWDLIYLNILTMLCCIPLITTGASWTAMQYTLLKIYRDEDDGVTKCFFRAFRSNFLQSTGLMLFFGEVLYLLWLNYTLTRDLDSELPDFLLVLLPVLIILVLCVGVWAFVLQARYRNSVFTTIKNAAFIALRHPIRSLLMAVLAFLPIILIKLTLRSVPVVILLGFTAGGLAQVQLYNSILVKLENGSRQDSVS